MSEFRIQDPCVDCRLRDLSETVEGRRELIIAGMVLAYCGYETMPDCRHPWRNLYAAHGGSLTDDQAEIVSRVVVRRGKDPAQYGLPEITTVDAVR